jgi:N-acetylneuraminate synthase
MMPNAIQLGSRMVGEGYPTFIIAEIGINHNGDLSIARRLIDVAVMAGCDAVKFQKRTPELSTPRHQWDIERDTPWGRIPYIEYRYKVEFGYDEYFQIDEYCKQRGIEWFVSPWDEGAVQFIKQFNPIAVKLASATITDINLLESVRGLDLPIIISTGMSTMKDIQNAVAYLGSARLLLAQCTSTYPCRLNELNLTVIKTFMEKFRSYPIGYSGHETGLAPTLAAVALGASFVERHITLDRAMWGSDQAASLEPNGITRLVRDIRLVETAMGDGIKRVIEREVPIMKKLRRVDSANGDLGRSVKLGN